MVMHINRSDPIGNQKIEKLKIWKSKIADRNQKSKIVITWMSNFDKILHGGVDLGFDLQTLGRYGKDGEDGDLIWNFSNRTANIYGKNFPVYNQV